MNAKQNRIDEIREKLERIVHFNVDTCDDHIDADQTITTVWDGNDATGKQVSSGVYYYKLITNTKVYQKKMLLVK